MKLKKALVGVLTAALTISSASFGVLAENDSGGANKENSGYILQSDVEYFRVGYLEDITSGISLLQVAQSVGLYNSLYFA